MPCCEGFQCKVASTNRNKCIPGTVSFRVISVVKLISLQFFYQLRNFSAFLGDSLVQMVKMNAAQHILVSYTRTNTSVAERHLLYALFIHQFSDFISNSFIQCGLNHAKIEGCRLGDGSHGASCCGGSCNYIGDKQSGIYTSHTDKDYECGCSSVNHACKSDSDCCAGKCTFDYKCCSTKGAICLSGSDCCSGGKCSSDHKCES